MESDKTDLELAQAVAELDRPQTSEVPTPERLDQLELAMLTSGAPVAEMPVVHTFTPGLYRRTILMKAGTLLTSRIHNTEHPYVVLAGAASVYIPGVGVEYIRAPYQGITKPGTRRVLYIHEDCIWATFHPINDDEWSEFDEEKRLSMIESRIIERRELIDGKSTFELYSELIEEAKTAGLLEEAP